MNISIILETKCMIWIFFQLMPITDNPLLLMVDTEIKDNFTICILKIRFYRVDYGHLNIK